MNPPTAESKYASRLAFCDICDGKCSSSDYTCSSCNLSLHLGCMSSVSHYSAKEPKCKRCLSMEQKSHKFAKYLCLACNDPTGFIVKKSTIVRPNVKLMNSNDHFHPICLSSCGKYQNFTNYSLKKCCLCDLSIDIAGVQCKQKDCEFRAHFRCVQYMRRHFNMFRSLDVRSFLHIELDCPHHEISQNYQANIAEFKFIYSELFSITKAVKEIYRHEHISKRMSKSVSKRKNCSKNKNQSFSNGKFQPVSCNRNQSIPKHKGFK
jgi:hypothetical protein